MKTPARSVKIITQDITQIKMMLVNRKNDDEEENNENEESEEQKEVEASEQ